MCPSDVVITETGVGHCSAIAQCDITRSSGCCQLVCTCCFCRWTPIISRRSFNSVVNLRCRHSFPLRGHLDDLLFVTVVCHAQLGQVWIVQVRAVQVNSATDDLGNLAQRVFSSVGGSASIPISPSLHQSGAAHDSRRRPTLVGVGARRKWRADRHRPGTRVDPVDGVLESAVRDDRAACRDVTESLFVGHGFVFGQDEADRHRGGTREAVAEQFEGQLTPNLNFFFKNNKQYIAYKCISRRGPTLISFAYPRTQLAARQIAAPSYPKQVFPCKEVPFGGLVDN